MDQILRITNVLSDSTRFNIYQYIVKKNDAVSVQDVASVFDIHPNVARLHLSKLQDVNLVVAYTKKTGRGGRPSKAYRLSDEVIDLHFPHRDYRMLATIAIDSLSELGEAGAQALYRTGERYGYDTLNHIRTSKNGEMDIELKLLHLRKTAEMIGLYPEFNISDDFKRATFTINNCPFKEIVKTNSELICGMHGHFIKGMFHALFEDIELKEAHTMMDGCKTCSYKAEFVQV
ncbi:helix-turn-helix transcriptional regulator [Thalassobacillus hwangdonensis]|uniref:helix-turn-helix transcriptional regulator n=1 Tax=Thalassobacillus hwangdonensis TaxID=546108 RepID=UPI0036DC185D